MNTSSSLIQPRTFDVESFVDIAGSLNLPGQLGGAGAGARSWQALLHRVSSPARLLVVGSAEDVARLRPLLPADHDRVDPGQLAEAASRRPCPEHVLLCTQPAREDDGYAEVMRVLTRSPWRRARVHRFYGDVLRNCLAGNDPLRGPWPPLAANWSRYRFYAVICTGRSGSSLLCDLLANTGTCGHPKEHLRDPGVYAMTRGLVSWPALLQSLVISESTPNGVFGTKIVSRHLLELLDGVDLAEVRRMLPPVRVIHLSRRDKIAQAASIVRARLTGRWHSIAGKQPPETLSRPLTDEELAVAVEEYHDNQRRQHQLDVLVRTLFPQDDVIEMAYEDLVASPERELTRALEHIGVKSGVDVGALHSRYQKIQSNDSIYDQMKSAVS